MSGDHCPLAARRGRPGRIGPRLGRGGGARRPGTGTLSRAGKTPQGGGRRCRYGIVVIDTVVGAGRGSPPDTAGAPRAKAPPEQSADSPSLSPLVLAYLVGPFALGLLLVFRGFGLVARLPVWAYFAAIVGACILSVLVEPWHDAPEGSFKLHVRLAVHVTSVSMVIYMTGWGPALGMAYAFVALQELQTWGAALWRPVMCWSLLNIAVAQYLLWLGWVPSFLTRSQAETVGALGAFVLVIVIRMAGATGEKKERAEALLAHQALHDMLTGLPNRSFFYDRTEDALERTAVGGSSCAVMLFDLDRFKEINDTMGHRYGDRVLTEVGPRVQAVLRGADVLARLGGDEFCVLLSQVASEADAVRVAQRIVAMLEMPFDVDGTILGIEASCGIAMAPPDGGSADLLLQQADVAMYVPRRRKGAWSSTRTSSTSTRRSGWPSSGTCAMPCCAPNSCSTTNRRRRCGPARCSVRKHSSGGSTRCSGSSVPTPSFRRRSERA